MKVAQAYMGNGEFQWVNLGTDVQVLHAENLNMQHLSTADREYKLSERLDKARDYYADKGLQVVGYIDGKTIGITLFEDGKWKGQIWSARATISGKYSRV